MIDAYTSWEWSTLCDEISKLDVDLHSTKLEFATGKTRHTRDSPCFRAGFATDLPPKTKHQ